jgi:diguanylate cyclase (GGDEF)-like protein/PAS domain S-box-containing protein
MVSTLTAMLAAGASGPREHVATCPDPRVPLMVAAHEVDPAGEASRHVASTILRPEMSSPPVQTDQTIELAAEALLREHPDALVAGISSNGLIVPIPQSIGLWGQAAIEGRAVTDAVVAADRTEVVKLWNGVAKDGSIRGKVRLLSKPSRWMTLYFIDLQASHGIRLCIVLPSDDAAEEDEVAADELPPAAPRFSTLTEDEGARVLTCDDSFTEMFGYSAEELIGESVLDQIHPDDQGRAVEGWIAVLSTRTVQQTRLRRRRKDGSWVWVDTTLHNYLNQPERNCVLVELIDVTAEMAVQEALQEREELLRRLTDAMPSGLLQFDTDRQVVYNNARLLNILQTSPGTAPDEVSLPIAGPGAPNQLPPSARSLLSTLTTEGRTVFAEALERVLEDGLDQDVEVDFLLGSGEWRRALMGVRALLRQSGEVSGAITSVLDVTDTARAHEELEKRATFDALTGAHNRSSILGALERELALEQSTTTGIVYLDLDEFKPVNDTLGHAAGDELLILVAERLRDVSRREDVVGRLGGDEFIVLLPGISGGEAAMQMAQRISASLNTAIELSRGTVELRASVGVACIDADTQSVDELVERADAAMYLSKSQAQGRPVLDDRAVRSVSSG